MAPSKPLQSARLQLVLLIVGVPVASAQFQNGNARNGMYESDRVYEEVAEKWVYRTGGAVRSSPTVSADRVYVGSSDGSLYCLDAHEGAKVWTFSSDGAVGSSPVVADEVVYFVSRANTLYAVATTNGRLVWKKSLGNDLPYPWAFDYYIGSAAVDDGYVYAGSGDGHLYAIRRSDGSDVWRFKTKSRVRSTPAVDDKHVYFGDCSGIVHAVDKRLGTETWRFATVGNSLKNEEFGYDRNGIIASPTLAGSTLLIGGRDGFLYALDATSGKVVFIHDGLYAAKKQKK